MLKSMGSKLTWLSDWTDWYEFWGFPGSSVGKKSACNEGDPDLIPGSGRCTGEGIGYPLQYSWASIVAQLVKNPPAMGESGPWSLGWEDPPEKGKSTHSSILAWRIPWTVYSPWSCKESDTTEWLSLSLWSSQVVLTVKNLPVNSGDIKDSGLTPGSGRYPGERNGNTLQYSYLENPMDRGAWRATVHGIAKSRMWLKWLSTHTFTPLNFGGTQTFSPHHRDSPQIENICSMKISLFVTH